MLMNPFFRIFFGDFRILQTRDDGTALDGEIDRAVYDKEGLYLGKVNQGTCMCSGCVDSRREVNPDTPPAKSFPLGLSQM